MKHGFKMHEFYVARGAYGRRPLDIMATGPNQDEDFLPRLCGYLDELCAAAEALDGKPTLVASADGENEHHAQPETSMPRTRFLDYTVTKRRISLNVRYGRLGEYETAMAALVADDADLVGRSPDQLFRVEILVPGLGTHGLMASEVISGRSPGSLVSTWISYTSRAELGSHDFEKLMTPAYAEPGKVDDLLNGNTPAWVRLVERQASVDGVKGRKGLELIDHALTGSKRDDVFGLIKSWRKDDQEAKAAAKKAQAPINTGARVKALVEAVGANLTDMPFNDGEVFLEEPGGRYTRITPSRVNDVFITEINDHRRPTPDEWAKAVRDRLMAEAKAANLSVGWD